MTANLNDRPPQQAIGERLRAAWARQGASLMTADDHERQRARVLASVLLSRRQDRASAGLTR
jgi:hypothetical protein